MGSLLINAGAAMKLLSILRTAIIKSPDVVGYNFVNTVFMVMTLGIGAFLVSHFMMYGNHWLLASLIALAAVMLSLPWMAASMMIGIKAAREQTFRFEVLQFFSLCRIWRVFLGVLLLAFMNFIATFPLQLAVQHVAIWMLGDTQHLIALTIISKCSHIVFSALFTACFVLVLPLLIDQNVGVLKALQGSLKLVRKQYLLIFTLMIVLQLSLLLPQLLLASGVIALHGLQVLASSLFAFALFAFWYAFNVISVGEVYRELSADLR